MSSHTTKPPALLNDGFSFMGDLSRMLTPDDVETLSHLLKRGIGENTLRATRSDLANSKPGLSRARESCWSGHPRRKSLCA